MKATTKINWDLIDAQMEHPEPEMPENGVTVKMIMDRYSVGHSAACVRMRKLCATGMFEMLKMRTPDNKTMNVMVPSK